VRYWADSTGFHAKVEYEAHAAYPLAEKEWQSGIKKQHNQSRARVLCKDLDYQILSLQQLSCKISLNHVKSKRHVSEAYFHPIPIRTHTVHHMIQINNSDV
jgi:hypothetical protein